MTELWYFIVSIVPSALSVLFSILIYFIFKKWTRDIFEEVKQNNELKKNNELTSKLLKDNQDLKKMNEKLLAELTRIKPMGWTDDK